MAFCVRCGARMEDTPLVCPRCGFPQGATQGPPPGPATVEPKASQSALSENAAGALSYALGWFSGLVFLLSDRRPYVRFHAAQSIVLFGGLNLMRLAIGTFFDASSIFFDWSAISGGVLLLTAVDLLILILWIGCMVSAAQGRRFEVPIVAGIAQTIAGQ